MVNIVIFTNTYPYGSGETFFETELPYLLSLKKRIVLLPLYGSGTMRFVPSSKEAPVATLPPLLPFPPKKRHKLLFHGLFNCAPLCFGINEFFAQSVWRSRTKMWRYATSWLLIRTVLSQNRRLFDRLLQPEQDASSNPQEAKIPTRSTLHKGDTITSSTIFYFYWGDKSALLLPFLRKRFRQRYGNAPFPRTIVRFHGSDLYEEATGFLPFRTRTLPHIDLACPVSRHGAEYLRQRYGVLTPPLLVARLGTIDWGLGPEPPFPNHQPPPLHIVTCARLVALKRIHLIWEALMLLHTTRRLTVPLRWTLIGEGPLRLELEREVRHSVQEGVVQEHSVQESAVKEHIVQEDVVQKDIAQKDIAQEGALSVHFTGHLPQDAIMEFYRNTPIDLFILTSESEGVPVSIMEALSFGIPVVATAVGGIPELVSEANGGLLPAHPKANDVAEAIQRFIHLSPSERRSKRQAARAAWEQEWNASVNFTKWTQVFTD